MALRAIDHVVHTVRDLDGAAERFERLGFTLTPRAAHGDHMGTSNRLAQFAERNFIELLEVDRPQGIFSHDFEAVPPRFSFGAHNRAAIAKREGLAMLVFQTGDTAADVARWQAAGVPTFAPFTFERQAKLPDGAERTVSFCLGFACFPEMPDIGIFVCENRAQDIFWKPDYQRHDNGAHGIRKVFVASPQPERDASLLARLFDCDVRKADENGYAVACAPGQSIDVRSFEAIGQIDPDFDASNQDRAILSGLEVATDQSDRVLVPSSQAHGCFIAWAPA